MQFEKGTPNRKNALILLVAAAAVLVVIVALVFGMLGAAIRPCITPNCAAPPRRM